MTQMRLVGVVLLVCVCGALICPVAMAQSSPSGVRFVHAVPDGSSFDLYANGNKIAANIERFGVSDYVDLSTGPYTFVLVPTGQEPTAGISLQATLNENLFYTLAATGRASQMELLVIADDLSDPGKDRGRLQIYHFSPDAPAVDLRRAFEQPVATPTSAATDATLPTPQPASENFETLIADVAYPTAGSSRELLIGTYSLKILPANVPAPVLADVPLPAIEPGKIYSVFVMDMLISITAKVAVAPFRTPAATPAMLPATSQGPVDIAPLLGLALVLLLSAAVVRCRKLW